MQCICNFFLNFCLVKAPAMLHFKLPYSFVTFLYSSRQTQNAARSDSEGCRKKNISDVSSYIHLLIHLIHIYLIHLTPDRKTNRDWVKVAADHSAKGHSDYSHIMPSGKWTLHRTFDGMLYFCFLSRQLIN